MYVYFSLSILFLLILFITYPKFKRGLFLISLITSSIYIIWRTLSIPYYGLNRYIGLVLFAAEILGLIQFLVFIYISSRNKKDDSIQELEYNNLPTVDIVIPTYGEPLYIIKKTIGAAIAIKYDNSKKEIYICDDAKRKDVKDLCDEFGIQYSIREDNEYAKSGNINNMLANSNGELIAVFDADMIPKSTFLNKTVPYFFDENIGFVQTPQSFYNPDIFQKLFNKKIPAEQDFFMRDVQEKRSYIDSEIHVGTNAVFRRKALDDIGGYPTFSITEDIALGFLVQSKGYKSAYLNEPLALGLNLANLRDFLTQRDRWCRRNIQLLKSKNPFKIKGLKNSQKIAYIDGLLSWYSSILKLIFMIAPIFYLLTGIFFIDAKIENLLMMFLPYFISQYLVFSVNSPNSRTMFWAHIYENILAPYNAKSCIYDMFKTEKLKFKVTNKDIKNTKKQIYLKEALPHIILVMFTLLSWGVGIYKIKENNLDVDIFLINLVWTIYNIIPMLILIKISFINDCEDSTEVNLSQDIYLNLNNENYKFKVLKISEDTITLKQDKQRIFLKGEEISLNLDNEYIIGNIQSSTNGKAIVKIKEISKNAYIMITSLYSDNLKPFYDIDKVIEQNNKINKLLREDI